MSSLRKLMLSLATVMVLATLSNDSFAQKGGGKTTTPKLSLTISPSTILEGNTATGTVTHNNSSTSSAVTVTLRSNDTSEATVPASVTIPAGTNSATFTVTTLNDGTVDGEQSVTISASATGYSAGSTIVTVTDKPVIAYWIETIPTAPNTECWVNGITNNSRVYGNMHQRVDGVVIYRTGFVYDQHSKTMYDMNQIPNITSQVTALAGPGFEVSGIVGMNESGIMVGGIRDNSETLLGIVIDTTIGGQFSPDPADWIVQLLPDFGSTFTSGRRINEFGDIVGHFRRSDGTIAAYLFNPWTGGTPQELPVNLLGYSNHVLNDHGQVAGIDEFRRAFLYDAATDSIRFFADANYINITGLNNSGVFAGYASVTITASKGNKTTTSGGAFRHDGTSVMLIGGTAGTSTSGCLNEDGDVGTNAMPSSNYVPILSHTGFEPDYKAAQLDITKLIATDDPLKEMFLNHSPDIFSINDRDLTGYPQIVSRLYTPSVNGGLNDTWAVILTPYLVP